MSISPPLTFVVRLAEKPLIYSTLDSGKPPSPGDFHLSPQLDEEIDIFGKRMSGTGPSSPIVKDEPEDWFNANLAMAHPHNINTQSNPSRFVGPGSIDPSELSTQSGSFNMSAFSGQPGSIAGSYPLGNAGMGNSGIGDDELLDLGDLNDKQPSPLNTNVGPHGQQDFGLFADQVQQNQTGMNPMFTTNTPNGDPIQSPFLHGGFNYQGYRNAQIAQHMSPHLRQQMMVNGQIDPNHPHFQAARARASLSQHMAERKPSDSRSPLTPKTPAQNGFEMSGTPESHGSAGMSLPHRHQASLSGGGSTAPWESNPASLHSMHSPGVSPATHPGHAPFSEVFKAGAKHGSPAIEGASVVGHHPGGVAAYQTQEAKRRRRRESHNMVERRRRDNINERIQELSHLVPAHRLEDEKLRKHLAANGPSPLSPTLSGISGAGSAPTSLLAGGNGGAANTRRPGSTGGVGNITLGLPPDDKDKGPNKGDILNGSVGWTRDLMWALHRCLAREERTRQMWAQRFPGEPCPLDADEDDDEHRMRSELLEAVQANHGAEAFGYSRGDGSGLRVPRFTNLAGDPLAQEEAARMQAGGHEVNQELGAGMWQCGGPTVFKEESEYEMQLQ